MKNASKHPDSDCLSPTPGRKRFLHRDWSKKDFLAWGLILATALSALVVLWTPLMLAPLSEITGAFVRLQHGQ